MVRESKLFLTLFFFRSLTLSFPAPQSDNRHCAQHTSQQIDQICEKHIEYLPSIELSVMLLSSILFRSRFVYAILHQK